MNQITQRRGVRQFVKFGIVGASGFVVNLVIFTLLQRVVPNHSEAVPYDIIYSLAFFAGGISNYFLNRAWTFRSTGHAGAEGAKFLTVSAIALVAGLLVSMLVAPYFGHGHKTWFIGTVAGIFINFFLNKYWTFRNVA
ncbi:MAG: GtrA family protein [Candidatus Eremiobacteraeota bacterium]|nr:GtrA family protein [Candidatus Eremiobacteraeota bacterium]